MKKTVFIIFALFAFSALMAKKSPFTVTFGSGGGFTGLTALYTLNSEGGFSKKDNVANKTEQLSKVKNKDVKEVRELASKVNFSILNINKSGNITTYITFAQDGNERKTQWTGATSGDPALDALNAKLVSLIPKK